MVRGVCGRELQLIVPRCACPRGVIRGGLATFAYVCSVPVSRHSARFRHVSKVPLTITKIELTAWSDKRTSEHPFLSHPQRLLDELELSKTSTVTNKGNS